MKPDLVHKLPHPQPPLDAASQPFVGNESVDDNLAECAEVAMWQAIGQADRSVDVRAESGVVHLSGTLSSAEEREAAKAAVEALDGVRSVVCQINVDGQAATRSRRAPKGAKQIPAEPLIYVVRYCGLDEASLSAAIRQAVAELDALFAGHQLPLPARLFVIYRNRGASTVTLEIGMPTTGGPELQTHTIRAGYSPSGLTLSAPAAAGVGPMLTAIGALAAKANKSGHVAAGHWWQIFEAAEFRPWRGHPAAPVQLPVLKLDKPQAAAADPGGGGAGANDPHRCGGGPGG